MPAYRAFTQFALASLLTSLLTGCSTHHTGAREKLSAAGEPEPPWPALQAQERLPLELCQRPNIEEPLLCGMLEVPLDRAAPRGPKISIRVVVVPATEEPSRTAWAEHQGGPGFSSLGNVRLFARGGPLERFRRQRDMIFFDQRGVGESSGIYCDALRPNPILRRRFPPELVRQCRQQLAGTFDLRHFSTFEAVDDLEAIRAWLGYEQLDLGGWSYGSRFMLTYMQRYPERVRSATLVVPTTIDYRRPLDWARFGEAAFDGLVAECQAEPACAAAIPDPKGDLQRLAHQLDTQPLRSELTHPESGQHLRAEVDRGVLRELFWQGMLGTGDARELPWLIHRAATGNPHVLLKAMTPEAPGALWSEPTYLSVVCAEEVAHIRPEEIDPAVAGTFIGRHFVDDWIAACRLWDLPPAPGTPSEPVELEIPTLIVSGGLDPCIQPEYGERIASHLANSLHVVVPSRGHNGGDMVGAQCLDDLILGFVEQGSVDGLDPSCLADMKAPPFAVADPE